jgi:methylthioribose-1-phosphate isomerase
MKLIVDQAAAWMLQAKCMNAKYIGSDNYAAAVPLITKITGSNYALHTNYNNCFWLIMIKMELKMNLFLPLRLTVFIHKLMVEQLS